MLKSTARSSSYDLNDSSITQTAGNDTANFQSLAGTDVSCLIILINCMLTGSATWGILKYREVGDTGNNDGDELIGFRQTAYGGGGAGTRLSQMHIVPASGVESGKFEYWTTAGQTVDDGLWMMYYGRIRR